MSLLMNELTLSGAGEPDGVPLTHLDMLPASLRDEVLQHLLLVLGPPFSRPDGAAPVLTGHAVSALRTFLATHPGRGRTVRSAARGSLPAWKERRIKELMQVEISGKLSVRRLATECGLSIRHFTRAFRQSTGLTPHRYLVKLRVLKARELLLQPTLPLHDIATSCGFADQSHFTRVFSAAEKMSPGTWRRLNLLSDASGIGYGFTSVPASAQS